MGDEAGLRERERCVMHYLHCSLYLEGLSMGYWSLLLRDISEQQEAFVIGWAALFLLLTPELELFLCLAS